MSEEARHGRSASTRRWASCERSWSTDPELEHSRLTPDERRRAAVRRRALGQAGQERARRVLRRDAGARRRGLRGRDLLADVIAQPEGREWILAHALERADGRTAWRRSVPGTGSSGAPPREVADFLIGGITPRDVREGHQFFGAFWTRRTCCCRRCRTSSSSATRRAGSSAASRSTPWRSRPASRRRCTWRPSTASTRCSRRTVAFRIWLGGVDEDWGSATVEGGDVQTIGNGAVMIGMGERRRPGRPAHRAGTLRSSGGKAVLAVHCPKSRSYMHLDTVFTMVDRDMVTAYPRWWRGSRLDHPPRRRRPTRRQSRRTPGGIRRAL